LGKFSNVEDCANRAGETGSQFFVYGTDSKAGKCYNEFTRSASCPEGWERDSYNFYEIRSGPSGASFELIKSGHECKSSDSFLGKFSNVEDCANRAGETGSQFFVYGTDSKAGKCYNEFTRSASCPEGWERDSYNFYEIRSGPSELALGRPVAEIEGEETVGESSLADSSDSSSYSSSDYEDSSESSSDWEDSSASFEAFEEFGAYNVLFFDATKGVLALVGLVAILFGLYRMTCGKAKTYTEIDRLETQDGYGANGEC